MKKFVFAILFISVGLLSSCGGDEGGQIAPPDPGSEELTAQQKAGKSLAEALWATTPLQRQPLDNNSFSHSFVMH